MNSVFRRIMSSLRFAVIGALTCAIATLVAELFLQTPLAMQPREESEEIAPLVIALLIDTSGSMAGEKISEVKEASIQFINSVERENTYIALISFSSNATLHHPILTPSQNPASLIEKVQKLDATGGTGMAHAIKLAREAFSGIEAPNNAILLFTDGVSSFPMGTLLQAEVLRREGTVIVAVGTADSDISFLNALTLGEPNKLFTTQLGEFATAFDQATEAIVAASAFGTVSTSQGLTVVTIVALFLATALLIAENVWGLRGNWWRDLWWMPPVGAVLGFSGAAIGENLFQIDIATWALVGLTSGVALGLTDLAMGWQPRNLHKVWRGALFGLSGGAVGGILFVAIYGNADIGTASGEITALISRLSGFGLLGFFIGLALKAGEEIFKDVWLLGTTKGPYEGKQYVFGKPEISVGRSGKNDIILAREHQLGLTEGRFIQIQKNWFYQPVANDASESFVGVNGAPIIQRTRLSDNTTISFGTTSFLFRRRGNLDQDVRKRNWVLVGNEDSFQLPVQDELRIGNSPSSDIVLTDPSIRAHHCTLKFSDQGLRIQGIGSAHIEINDQPILPKTYVVLRQGDLITLGRIELGLVAHDNFSMHSDRDNRQFEAS